MGLIQRITSLARAIATDPRIPTRDRLIIAAMLTYLAAPFDLIPDFIPLLGYADDLVVVILLLDYALNHMDRSLVREHWPWSERALQRAACIVGAAARLVPGIVRQRIWQSGARGTVEDAGGANVAMSSAVPTPRTPEQTSKMG